MPLVHSAFCHDHIMAPGTSWSGQLICVPTSVTLDFSLQRNHLKPRCRSAFGSLVDPDRVDRTDCCSGVSDIAQSAEEVLGSANW